MAVLVLTASLGATSARLEAQFTVVQPPRLQLGDAPLAGFPGSDADRVQIIWQTIPAGSGAADSFVVLYRREGTEEWLDAGEVSVIETGVGGRAMRYADVIGLEYDAGYEYRVVQLRGDAEIASYRGSFHTRLPEGDVSPFSFVAYGDSAARSSLTSFRAVQSRINELDPAFALLLGDNAYEGGRHSELDARFDAALDPEAAVWTSGHVDYVSFGNHDVRTDGGRPTEGSFAVPVPVEGVTAPAGLPAGERPEHDYSFDYGLVHFVTFDTNALGDPARLERLMAWVTADLRASRQPWKIVFGHHPVAGTPDKPERPSGAYYRTVVPALAAAGADAFLVGHSHTFGWSHPLTGEEGGAATFVRYRGTKYREGDGVVQVVVGVGGAHLRPGSYSGIPFMASGFTQSTDRPSEHGLLLVEVTAKSLTFGYVAADDGEVIDSFTIVADPRGWGSPGPWMLAFRAR